MDGGAADVNPLKPFGTGLEKGAGGTSHATANSQLNTGSTGVEAELPSELNMSPAPLLQHNLPVSRAGGGGRRGKRCKGLLL